MSQHDSGLIHPMKRLAVLVGFALTLASGSISSRATAAGEDRAMALELFAQGRALFKSGNYAAALEQFEAAAKEMRTFGILFNIAECQEKLGRTASAWATWREARSVAVEGGHADDEDTAAARQRALESVLSRLTIVAPPDVDLPGLEVRRDDALIPREAWGMAIPVDPGLHVVVERAPGRKTRRLEVSLQDHAGKRTLTLLPLEPEVAPSSPVAADRAASRPLFASQVSSNAGSGQRVAGWVLGGLGVAAVGAGIAVALVGQGQHNDAVATDLAGNVPQAQNMESDANTTKAIGYVTIGGGAAFVVTGLVLVLTSPAPAASASGSVSLGPGGFCIGGRRAFFSMEW
jgi:hypothetical protein